MREGTKCQLDESILQVNTSFPPIFLAFELVTYLIHNYTVAKVVMDCNFDLNSDRFECKEVTHGGKTYRMAFLACVYKCN